MYRVRNFYPSRKVAGIYTTSPKVVKPTSPKVANTNPRKKVTEIPALEMSNKYIDKKPSSHKKKIQRKARRDHFKS